MAKHIFIGKSVVLHLCEGPELRRHYWQDRKEKKKAKHPAEFEPTTSRVLLCRRALYRCATTAAQSGHMQCSQKIWWKLSPFHIPINERTTLWTCKQVFTTIFGTQIILVTKIPFKILVDPSAIHDLDYLTASKLHQFICWLRLSALAKFYTLVSIRKL